MRPSVQNLLEVQKAISDSARQHQTPDKKIQLVAVSKNHEMEIIRPVLEYGHRIFGENRVQEAAAKWPELRTEFSGIELHLIGPLQSNKAGDAVALFDVIQTIDREKIARAIAKEMKDQNRKPVLLVQVNIGDEPQKAGISTGKCVEFIDRCRSEHGLNISGLMCIPPNDQNPGPYFALLAKLAVQAGVDGLSMGMSADYETAIQFGADWVRVGSAIFGSR